MGGAPPHKNNLIGTAAGGVSKLVPFKTTNAALNRSLSSSLFNLLADDLEASLDTRMEVFLRLKDLHAYGKICESVHKTASANKICKRKRSFAKV